MAEISEKETTDLEMIAKSEREFVRVFDDQAATVHHLSREKGWYDSERSDGEMIALMHSELSEGLEAARHGNPPSDHIPEFTGLEEEMADTIIRIMDFGAARDLRIGEAIVAKTKFNATRPYKHGGKKF